MSYFSCLTANLFIVIFFFFRSPLRFSPILPQTSLPETKPSSLPSTRRPRLRTTTLAPVDSHHNINTDTDQLPALFAHPMLREKTSRLPEPVPHDFVIGALLVAFCLGGSVLVLSQYSTVAISTWVATPISHIFKATVCSHFSTLLCYLSSTSTI